MSHFREHTRCRACGSDRLDVYLDLGAQPLANAFLRRDQLTEPEFTAPLQLARCLQCDLSQLTHVVDPDLLYRHYHYESGHAAGWHDHCAALAEETRAMAGPRKLVYDLACNDGVLLRACQDVGCHVVGVDPALNLRTGPVPVVREFWTEDLAKRCADWPGTPDIVVAQNVLGHVDDVLDFLKGIAWALRVGGTAIIECPHILPLLERTAFDTVYHEHLSYWSLGPLQRLAARAHLTVVRVRRFPDLHGGTVRYYLRPALPSARPDASVEGLLADETALTPERYQAFTGCVQTTTARLRQILAEYGASQALYAYGASAKSTVLLNAVDPEHFLATASIRAIFDDTPGKQGLFAPGTSLPVVAPPEDFSKVSALLVTAPNWYRELREKVIARGFRGTFLVPWQGVLVESAES